MSTTSVDQVLNSLALYHDAVLGVTFDLEDNDRRQILLSESSGVQFLV